MHSLPWHKKLLKCLIRGFFRLLYDARIEGLEHYEAAGERVLIVANHSSFLDAALIAAFLPHAVTFAVNTHIATARWLRPFLGLVDSFPLDPGNPMAVKALIHKLRENARCMIFPEGRITVTGALMKIYEGPGMIADKADAMLLPIRIDGAQYSPFSRLKGKVRRRWFPRIRLQVLPPRRFHVADDIKGKKRRQAAGAQLYDVMSEMMFDSSHAHETLWQSLLTARAIHGGSHVIVEDVARQPLTYRQLLRRALALSRWIGRTAPGEPTLGLMLPASLAANAAFFALQAEGRTVAMLNFTAGVGPILSACRAAQVKTVLCARKFIETARLESLIEAMETGGIRVIRLEDVRGEIGVADKLWALAAAELPALARRAATNPDAPAIVLFTSGSEGAPKGVALSHANLNANRFQLAARVDFGATDIVFNCLPMFHAFGLTGGTLMPILSGIRTFFYPSPLHYRIVPELIYDTNATIFFATDTFLAGYARFAHPYDMHSLRYVFSGAEKLRDATRSVYAEKFGVRIFEGYGATEAAPALSTNTPMQNRPSTVGRLMPGIRHKLVPVPGIEQGGQLWVKGPNVMLGYLRESAPGVIQPPEGGWYDTGDVVAEDAEGYLTIVGRTKRFAKIAGEMVSLASVEATVASLWPEAHHAVIAVPDEKKGEQLILLTDQEPADRAALAAQFKSRQQPELAVPRKIIYIAKMPLLATGKTDYVLAKELALKAR